MATATAAEKKVKRARPAGDPELLEALADPWRLINATPEEVSSALAGDPPGEVAAILAALREAQRAIREGVKKGKMAAWGDRPIQQQVTLALVGADLASSLADDPSGPLAGLEQALLFLITLASSGWRGNLFVCKWCGKVGLADRNRRRFCDDRCRSAFNYRRKTGEKV